MGYKKELAYKIKKIIYTKDISLTALSKKAKVGYRTVRDFINDAENTTLLNVCKIGKGLDIDFDDMKIIMEIHIKQERQKQGIGMTELA